MHIVLGNFLKAFYLVFLMPSVVTLAQSAPESSMNRVPLFASGSDSASVGYLFGIHPRSVPAYSGSSGSDKSPRRCHGLESSANIAHDRANRQREAEWAAGNKLAAKVEREETIIDDPVLTEYLNRLEQAIVQHSDLRGCFVVKLLDDVEANAFSLPGGFLYVTSGLILVADSEGELTAALAHETGHVAARHFARIEHQRRIWGRVVLAGGPAGYLVRRFLGPLLTRKLIRNSEFEADQLSLKYQSASGYDPGEFSRLLQNAFQDDDESPSFVERLFDTHPLTITRIKRLDKLKDRLRSGRINYRADTGKFHEIKERLALQLKLANSESSPQEVP
jgi:predicted Zn-dependent protease